MLAQLRFSCQDGSNAISFDPGRSTIKFALRACVGKETQVA